MTGAPWIILHNEWMRPEVVKEGGRVWSGPLVGHSIFCLFRTDIIWGNDMGATSNGDALQRKGTRPTPQPESVTALHFPGHPGQSLDRHMALAKSISAFTNIFQAWAEGKYSLFFDQRAARMCTQGSYVFYAHGGSWSERMMPTGRDSKTGDGERASLTRVQLIRPFRGVTVHLQICEPIQASLINNPPQKQNTWAARLSLRLPKNTNVSRSTGIAGVSSQKHKG